MEHYGVVTKTAEWTLSSLLLLALEQLAEATFIDSVYEHRAVHRMFNDEKGLFEMLGSLVSFDPAREGAIISLAHFTLQEYLQSAEP